MTTTEKIETIKEKIDSITTCVLVTTDEHGHLHGRPMTTQEIDMEGDIWFMTSKSSRKIKEIEKNPQIGLLYGDSQSMPFTSISGEAELNHDRTKIHQLWSPLYEAWFTGKDDPDIVLIKASIIGAEYWDHSGGKLGAYIDMATAAVTGEPLKNQENEKIKVV